MYLMDNAGGPGHGESARLVPLPLQPGQLRRIRWRVRYRSPGSRDAHPPRPSNPAPRGGRGQATTDGTGRWVTWVAPSDLGGPSVTYTVTATSRRRGAPLPARRRVSRARTHTFTGLTLGTPTRSRSAVATTQPGRRIGLGPADVTPSRPAGAPGVPTRIRIVEVGSRGRPQLSPGRPPIDRRTQMQCVHRNRVRRRNHLVTSLPRSGVRRALFPTCSTDTDVHLHRAGEERRRAPARPRRVRSDGPRPIRSPARPPRASRVARGHR